VIKSGSGVTCTVGDVLKSDTNIALVANRPYQYGTNLAAGACASPIITVYYDLLASHEFSFTVLETTIAEGDPALTLTVTRAGPEARVTGGGAPVEITGALALLTAAAADLTAPASLGKLAWSQGSTERTLAFAEVIVALEDDVSPEADETLKVTLTLGSGHPLSYACLVAGSSVATITIEDSSPPALPALSFAGAAVNGDEGATVTLTVTRVGASTTSLTAPLTVSYGTATASDITGALPSQVVFAGNATTAELLIDLEDDVFPEGAESLTLTLGTGTEYTLRSPSVATVTLGASDPTSVQMSAATVEGSEGASAVLTLTRTGSLAGSFNVALVVSYPGAATASDLTGAAPASAAFADGASQSTVSFALANDKLAEAAETYLVTLGAASGFAGGASGNAIVVTAGDVDKTTVKILDVNEVTVAFLPAPLVYRSAAAVTLTVTRTPSDVTGTFTASLAYTGTAATGSYTAAATVLVSEATTTTFTLPFTSVRAEDTIVVTLSALGAPGTASGHYTIGPSSVCTVTVLGDPQVTATSPVLTRGDTITLFGKYFRSGAAFSLSLAGVAVSGGVTRVSDTIVTAQAPVGTGAARSVALTVLPHK
jgi:hypothetical protein